MSSPEIETLDQLLGGELSLTVIRRLFPDQGTFAQGTMGLIATGDACLVASAGGDVPLWRCSELFADPRFLEKDLDKFQLRITDQGVRRIT